MQPASDDMSSDDEKLEEKLEDEEKLEEKLEDLEEEEEEERAPQRKNRAERNGVFFSKVEDKTKTRKQNTQARKQAK